MIERVKMKTTVITFFVLLLLAFQVYPQRYLEKEFQGYRNPDELISISASAGFSQAIELLSKISERTTGRKIVSTVQSNDPVGIEMTNMPYDKALVILVQYHDLTYEEKEDVIIVKRKNEQTTTPETYASVDSRDVKISAVFFEMDVDESRERGVDWKVIFSKSGLSLGSELIGTSEGSSGGAQQQRPPTYNLTGEHTGFDLGSGWTGEASALFKFFEEENLGEIIASPNIIVRDRNKGRIQVGSDFSVKQRDFAGNVVETFFPTGTIIEVTPFVYEEDKVTYMLLDIAAERSTFVGGGDIGTVTEIRKTNATTQVVMLNGEQAVIGGLFINEEATIRTGIPLLKDLPGWFFGLRYLFGSDENVVRKKELVILLEVELLPTLKERVAATTPGNLLKDEVEKQNRKLKLYQFNQKQYDK